MKIKKVKLAGFKSFLDPATIEINADMTGIVGPNGCGKSNIIDATRWVMGQSARNIRAFNVEDVIFSGTDSRKPAGRASVELVFDNEGGSFGGQYAAYSEISVRRTADRTRESKYFINNTRCRRRDVADLFFGTGLGAHSYALIEQGMISRIIEANPQEMRLYVEEAAGISKYRDRRRETEIRMRHTRENLDRLLDVREEVDKQLAKLKRQARSARLYKKLRLERDRLTACTALLELRGHEADCDEHDRQLSDLRIEIERKQAAVRGKEAEIEEKHTLQDECNHRLNEAREKFYRLNAEVGGAEQEIVNRRKNAEQIRGEVTAVAVALEKCRAKIAEEEKKRGRTAAQLSETEKAADAAGGDLANLERNLKEQEIAFAKTSREWERHHDDAAQAGESLKIVRVKIEYCDRELRELAAREKELKEQKASLDVGRMERQVADLSGERHRRRDEAHKHAEQINALQGAIAATRTVLRELEQANEALQGRLQETREQLASLKALQAADGGEAFSEWLARHGLSAAPRLAALVRPDSRWEAAVETVLGAFLGAVEVDSLDRYAGNSDQPQPDMLVMFERTGDVAGKEGSLAAKVNADCGINSFLNQIALADDLGQALAMRKEFSGHESAVTPDGFWVGRNWIRAHRHGNKEESILMRQRMIEDLSVQHDEMEREFKALQEQTGASRVKLSDAESRLAKVRGERDTLLNRLSAAETEWRHAEVKLSHSRDLIAELDHKGGEIGERRKSIERQRTGHLERRDALMSEAPGAGAGHDGIRKDRMEAERKVASLRDDFGKARNHLHEIEIRRHSSATLLKSLDESLVNLRQQKEDLGGRHQSLEKTEKEFNDPVESKESELERLSAKRSECEKEVKAGEEALNTVRLELEQLVQQCRRMEGERAQMLERREKIGIQRKESQVRREDAEQRISKLDTSPEAVAAQLREGDDTESLRDALANVEKRIGRLGLINLIADQEFTELSERKEYLDSQHSDLTSALETLEKAIAKIDKDSREKFKNTFDSINERMKDSFARLFGGGKAYLELLENDWLKGGIAVMARPPGKMLSSIKLLSGGEKALAALSVVFAIFDLNPAPFCMLDEVDAPLDENNVARFCELLKDMSNRIQFVIITHNRLTMESMGCLMGVTMGEPGISRLVSVNVDEAVKMAAE